jgi:malate/lactate dehydrogenase
VALSLPTVVDVSGAVDVIPTKMDTAEREGLERSAGVLRNAIASLK